MTKRRLHALEVLGFAVVLTAMLFVAYWSAFSVFRPWDDEGSHLEAIKAFLAGAPLYTGTYAYHGPFHFELFALLYRFDPAAATSDAARFAVVGIWTLTSLAAGLCVRRITSSGLFGIAAMVAWFSVCRELTSEPGHPLTVAVLLLAAAGLAFAYLMPARRRAAMIVLGITAGLLTMTKVNVGGFMIIAVAFAAAISIPSLASVRRVAPAAAILLPFALMASDLGTAEWRNFAIAVSAGLAAIAIVALKADHRGPRGETPGRPDLLAFGAAAAAAACVSMLLLVVDGSSPLDVLYGAFLIAAEHPNVNESLMAVDRDVVTWSLIGLGAAIAVARAGAMGRLTTRWSAGLRIAGGVAILAAVAGVPGLSLNEAHSMLLVPTLLAWIVAVPPAGERSSPFERFTRTSIASIAVLQTLHVYPVAASQRGPASVFFVIAAAVAIRDGLQELPEPETARFAGTLAGGVAAGVMVLAILVPGLFFTSRDYRAGVPLPFPGAERMRLDPATAGVYVRIVDLLKQHCDAFVGLPGYYSLNAWSGIPPVNDTIVNQWMPLLDASQQQSIVDALFAHERPCAVRNQEQLDAWQQGKPVPRLPLAVAIQDMTSVARSGPFELLVPRGRAESVRRAIPG